MKKEPTFGLYGTRKDSNSAIKDAVQAEKAGFDSYWFTDHIIDDNVYIPHSELWTVLGAIGALTKRIILGSGVTDPFRRNPAVTAQAVLSLHEITGGRAILGIGAGEAMNLTPFGIRYEQPVEHLRDAITAIRLLWGSSAERPVSFTGSVNLLRNAFLQMQTSSTPKLFVGALGSKTRRLAGELGDGLIPWINSPETFKNRLKDLEEGSRIAGRDLHNIEKYATIEISLSDDRENARKTVMPSAKASLICEQRTLEEFGYATNLDKSVSIQQGIFSSNVFSKIRQLASEVPDEYAERVCVFGNADDCISGFEKFVRAGATGFLISNSSPDYDFAIEKLEKVIMPYFRENS